MKERFVLLHQIFVVAATHAYLLLGFCLVMMPPKLIFSSQKHSLHEPHYRIHRWQLMLWSTSNTIFSGFKLGGVRVACQCTDGGGDSDGTDNTDDDEDVVVDNADDDDDGVSLLSKSKVHCQNDLWFFVFFSSRLHRKLQLIKWNEECVTHTHTPDSVKLGIVSIAGEIVDIKWNDTIQHLVCAHTTPFFMI